MWFCYIYTVIMRDNKYLLNTVMSVNKTFYGAMGQIVLDVKKLTFWWGFKDKPQSGCTM